jgi:hypothetical protein
MFRELRLQTQRSLDLRVRRDSLIDLRVYLLRYLSD